MKNSPSQTITSIILVLNFFIAELRRPIYNPLGIFNFKTKDIVIYKKPSMAIVPLHTNDSKGIELLNLRVGADQRFLEFLFLNSRLIPIVTAMEIIYRLITENIVYRRFSDKKVIITYIIGVEEIDHGDGYPETRKIEITLHRNTVVSNYTTWGEFYSFIRSHIKQSYLDGYNFEIPTMLRVRVWNVDHLANTQIKHSGGTLTIIENLRQNVKKLDSGNTTGLYDKLTKVSDNLKARSKAYDRSKRMSTALRKYLKDHGRGYSTMAYSNLSSSNNTNLLNKNQLINPLSRRSVKPSEFATMDIETITFNGHQLPCLISIKLTSQVKVFRAKKLDVESVFFMWVEFFDYLEEKSNSKTVTIFSHNLGGFDGIFLSKFVNSYFDIEQVETVVDAYRKHLSFRITVNGKTFLFLDSLRIFPVSLQSLCSVFGVEGKVAPYNPKWNSATVFDNKEEFKKLIKYVGQDSVALKKALKVAQMIYINKYGVDITNVVSLPMLAMKIFRLNFQKEPIPILTGFNEHFVRKGYFGGAVDIYKAHAKNCYYYDIVSLYPYAMCKPMPLVLLETLTGKGLENFDLANFFGFIELELECPQSVKRPVLPLRWKNRTIYPRGRFSGVYFSEEIKDILDYGYQIRSIKCAKRFSKGYIFNEYVQEMFAMKKNSVGPQRWIAKLSLNSLYGTFGRRQDLLKTVSVPNDMVSAYLVTYPSGTVLESSDTTSTILYVDKPNYQALDQLSSIYVDDSTFKKNVKANVAIAAAITSYARIHMNQIKQLDCVIYSDTYSTLLTLF